MSLILPQTVAIRPYGKNYKMLKEKGYPLLMKKATQGRKMVVDRNQYINVHVLDLFPQSNEKVYCNCDNCGRILHIQYCIYMKESNNGKDKNYCHKCGIQIKNTGDKCYNWNKDLTDEERKNKRTYPEYSLFIRNVLDRDNYTCQCCGYKGKDLNVHHLNGYNWDKEHRLDTTNGITLCRKCHENFHIIYGRGNNTKEQFEEWIGYRIQLKEYNEIRSTPKIICLETGDIFANIAEAAKKENLSYNSVYYNCCGRSRICRNNGKHYEYYERYLHMSEDEINKKLNDYSAYQKYKALVCLTTGEKFDNAIDASKKYNIKDYSNIFSSIETKRYGYCGVYNNVGLYWMFFDKFDNLSNIEKESIYLNNKNTILDSSYIYELFN